MRMYESHLELVPDLGLRKMIVFKTPSLMPANRQMDPLNLASGFSAGTPQWGFSNAVVDVWAQLEERPALRRAWKIVGGIDWNTHG